jgi:hypothetical protein
MALESVPPPRAAKEDPEFYDPRIWKALCRDLPFVRSDDGLWRDAGCGAFRWRDGTLLFDLPLGRWLRYSGARVEFRSREIKHLDSDGVLVSTTIDGPQILALTPEERTLHGGLLVENAVQAIARDILAEAILRIEDAGLRIVLHVHDEVVAEVREADADQAGDGLRRPTSGALLGARTPTRCRRMGFRQVRQVGKFGAEQQAEDHEGATVKGRNDEQEAVQMC